MDMTFLGCFYGKYMPCFKNIGRIFSCLLLTACANEVETLYTGHRLLEGTFSLQLTAKVGDMSTRVAGGMEAWSGDGSELIAVRMEDNGQAIGKYVIKDLSGQAQPATGTPPLYWQSTEETTVEAWYPFAESEKTYQLSDQSQGYADLDFLYGYTLGNYAQPVKLTFYHQLAKVKYTLVAGKGITDEMLKIATVKLLGENSVKVKGGKLTETPSHADREIIPMMNGLSGEALLPPQDMAGKKFICVNLGNTSFYYTPQLNEANLTAGVCHDYTITVLHDGITVQLSDNASWQAGADENIALEENCITYNGTESEPKIGDYYYTDGTWSDGGLRKLYPSNGTMEFLAKKPNQVSGKQVIGTIFALGHSPYDHSDYTQSGIGKAQCNGYVVARADVSTSSDYYGNVLQNEHLYPTDEDGNALDNFSSPQTDWSGYAYTQKYVEAANGNLDDKQYDYRAVKHAVVTYLQNHDKHIAPKKSTGWFLPSIGQLRQIFLVQHQGGYHSQLKLETAAPYFSSSLHYNQGNMPLGMSYVTQIKNINNSTKGYVRPILAF